MSFARAFAVVAVLAFAGGFAVREISQDDRPAPPAPVAIADPIENFDAVLRVGRLGSRPPSYPEPTPTIGSFASFQTDGGEIGSSGGAYDAPVQSGPSGSGSSTPSRPYGIGTGSGCACP